jgi:hypothetical protein
MVYAARPPSYAEADWGAFFGRIKTAADEAKKAYQVPLPGATYGSQMPKLPDLRTYENLTPKPILKLNLDISKPDVSGVATDFVSDLNASLRKSPIELDFTLPPSTRVAKEMARASAEVSAKLRTSSIRSQVYRQLLADEWQSLQNLTSAEQELAAARTATSLGYATDPVVRLTTAHETAAAAYAKSTAALDAFRDNEEVAAKAIAEVEKALNLQTAADIRAAQKAAWLAEALRTQGIATQYVADGNALLGGRALSAARAEALHGAQLDALTKSTTNYNEVLAKQTLIQEASVDAFTGATKMERARNSVLLNIAAAVDTKNAAAAVDELTVSLKTLTETPTSFNAAFVLDDVRAYAQELQTISAQMKDLLKASAMSVEETTKDLNLLRTRYQSVIKIIRTMGKGYSITEVASEGATAVRQAVAEMRAEVYLMPAVDMEATAHVTKIVVPKGPLPVELTPIIQAPKAILSIAEQQEFVLRTIGNETLWVKVAMENAKASAEAARKTAKVVMGSTRDTSRVPESLIPKAAVVDPTANLNVQLKAFRDNITKADQEVLRLKDIQKDVAKATEIPAMFKDINAEVEAAEASLANYNLAEKAFIETQKQAGWVLQSAEQVAPKTRWLDRLASKSKAAGVTAGEDAARGVAEGFVRATPEVAAAGTKVAEAGAKAAENVVKLGKFAKIGNAAAIGLTAFIQGYLSKQAVDKIRKSSDNLATKVWKSFWEVTQRGPSEMIMLPGLNDLVKGWGGITDVGELGFSEATKKAFKESTVGFITDTLKSLGKASFKQLNVPIKFISDWQNLGFKEALSKGWTEAKNSFMNGLRGLKAFIKVIPIVGDTSSWLKRNTLDKIFPPKASAAVVQARANVILLKTSLDALFNQKIAADDPRITKITQQLRKTIKNAKDPKVKEWAQSALADDLGKQAAYWQKQGAAGVKPTQALIAELLKLRDTVKDGKIKDEITAALEAADPSGAFAATGIKDVKDRFDALQASLATLAKMGPNAPAASIAAVNDELLKMWANTDNSALKKAIADVMDSFSGTVPGLSMAPSLKNAENLRLKMMDAKEAVRFSLGTAGTLDDAKAKNSMDAVTKSAVDMYNAAKAAGEPDIMAGIKSWLPNIEDLATKADAAAASLTAMQASIDAQDFANKIINVKNAFGQVSPVAQGQALSAGWIDAEGAAKAGYEIVENVVKETQAELV